LKLQVKSEPVEPQNIEKRMSKDGIAALIHFIIKQREYITSKFVIRFFKFLI